MRLFKGSATYQTMDSIISGIEKFSFNELEEKPTLLVEGKDDYNVIQMHYHMNEKKLEFEVILANDNEKDINGKRKVFEAYDKYNIHFSKLMCLVDCDYDYLLGETREDPNIYYYDYFEIENYIFEEDVLKVLFARYFECRDSIKFIQLKEELSRLEKIFYPYFYACFFRELHYRKRLTITLEGERIEKLASLLGEKPVSILKNGTYIDLDYEDRIKTYFEDKLKEINLNLDEILDLSGAQSVEVAAGSDIVDDFSFFKYFIGGKNILSAITFLMSEFETGTYIKNGDNLSLEKSLKNEWIPVHSKKFKELLNSLEEQLIT